MQFDSLSTQNIKDVFVGFNSILNHVCPNKHSSFSSSNPILWPNEDHVTFFLVVALVLLSWSVTFLLLVCSGKFKVYSSMFIVFKK